MASATSAELPAVVRPLRARQTQHSAWHAIVSYFTECGVHGSDLRGNGGAGGAPVPNGCLHTRTPPCYPYAVGEGLCRPPGGEQAVGINVGALRIPSYAAFLHLTCFHRGHRIGSRLVDDFCSKNPKIKCRSFKDSMDAVATVSVERQASAFRAAARELPGPAPPQIALPAYLGLKGCHLEKWNSEGTNVCVVMPGNPLEKWVELPAELVELQYCNIIAGAIRGALEMVNLRVTVEVESDALKGDAETSLRITLAEVIKVQAGEQYRDE